MSCIDALSQTLHEPCARISMARGVVMTGKFSPQFKSYFRPAALAATLALLAGLTASPARADRCDDIAKQLAGQIDGVKVGITAANVIYLSHPAAKELSLGCRGRNYSNELYAK